ncbi:MAG TPA: hypothetical protein VFD92_14705 [Candidatus Binatia bacterium]|nr:hypothetical protein [Candidatus Binatia bacterium]
MVDNLQGARQPETAFQRPRKNVTGVIELADTDLGIVIKRVELQATVQTQLHFRAGCVGRRCIIDEVDAGTQTASVVAAARGANGEVSLAP